MKTISVTEYLNYEARKFSKSKGIGVFGNDAKDTTILVEVWRYYLLTNRAEVSETLFTWSDLQKKLNTELLNNLGNFVNHVLSFIANPADQGYDSIIPTALDDVSGNSHNPTKKLASKVATYLEQYIEVTKSYLIDMYAKFGLIRTSELLSEKNCSSDTDQAMWNAMIDGYTQNGLNEKAILLLKDILVQNVLPNAVTLASILPACSSMGSMGFDRKIHGFSIRHFLEKNVYVGCASVVRQNLLSSSKISLDKGKLAML